MATGTPNPFAGLLGEGAGAQGAGVTPAADGRDEAEVLPHPLRYAALMEAPLAHSIITLALYCLTRRCRCNAVVHTDL